MTPQFFMGGRGRFERVHVGSWSLCVGFFSRYGNCCMRSVSYVILYMGCEGTMWAIATSACAVAASLCAFQALCGLFCPPHGMLHLLFGPLQTLCGMLQAPCGLLQTLCGLLQPTKTEN